MYDLLWNSWNALRLKIMISSSFKHTLHFVMFSVITNIYNKETIGPSLVELFTATEKVKKFFLTTRDFQCVHQG